MLCCKRANSHKCIGLFMVTAPQTSLTKQCWFYGFALTKFQCIKHTWSLYGRKIRQLLNITDYSETVLSVLDFFKYLCFWGKRFYSSEYRVLFPCPCTSLQVMFNSPHLHYLISWMIVKIWKYSSKISQLNNCSRSTQDQISQYGVSSQDKAYSVIIYPCISTGIQPVAIFSN